MVRCLDQRLPERSAYLQSDQKPLHEDTIQSQHERIAAAKKLHFDGISIQEIAQRLDTKAKTVEGWIARPTPRKRNRVANI